MRVKKVKPQPQYPEHERMRAVHDKAQVLGAFLEWLESDGRSIGEYHEHSGECGGHERGHIAPECGMIGFSHTGRYLLPPLYRWEPASQGERIEKILAMYFGIDLDKIRNEKQAMYEELVEESVQCGTK